MSNLKAPSVYIESVLSQSIESVNSSIPVFIGYTETHVDSQSNDLILKPTKITSIADYIQFFGTSPAHDFKVNLLQEKDEQTGKVLNTVVTIAGNHSDLPVSFLYYSLQLYFFNGGGECYIISLGAWQGTTNKIDFINALNKLENYSEPSMIVFPDVCSNSEEDYGDIIDTALFHCSKIGNRVLIVDVKNAYIGETEKNIHINNRFRSKIISEVKYLKHGAAYFPYLETTIPFIISEENIEVFSHKIQINNQTSLGTYSGLNLSESLIKDQDTLTYNAIKSFVQNHCVTLPPSGAVAGAIVRNDIDRNVWKAPANLSLSYVKGPEIAITDSFQQQLNADPRSGKSVNAIRLFSGKGPLIWGARTLAGNDNEWRYLSVVRFFLMVEESINTALQSFAASPNDANTWITIKKMIENYLLSFYQSGALSGQRQEEAFFVKVGLGTTMTANDIQNGDLYIEIGMAVVRPAEFIVVKIHKKMQMPKPTIWKRIILPFKIIPKFIKRWF